MYLPLGLRMRDVGLLEIQKAASFNDTETLGFVSAGYLKLYADTIIKMRDEKLYDPEIAITGNAATANEAFATGKTAMLFNGTWWYGSVRNQFPEVDDFIGFQPIPAMDNKVLYGSKGQDSALSVSAISPYQEEIKTIVKEIFSDERLMAWSNKRGAPSSFPKVKSQWGSPEIMDRINNIFENEYCQVIQTFAPAGFGLDVMGAQVQEIIVDTMKPEDYPQTFQDFWDSCF
jgi:ABC-type glycerol-3-phosphate transport system substrate-binding protein